MTDFEPTPLTRVKRVYKRGAYDRKTVYAILDATPLCHVGYVIDGHPAVTPTLQWREGDHVYWHGSSASRALRSSQGLDVCLSVSLLDGLVLARSGFHHSANYRSVMIYGRAEKVEGDAKKTARLRTFMEQLYPGRWEQLRPMTAKELKATTLLSLSLEQVSAKIRAEGVKDDEADYDWPVWAGTIPIRQVLDAPQPDPRNLPDMEIPPELADITIG